MPPGFEQGVQVLLVQQRRHFAIKLRFLHLDQSPSGPRPELVNTKPLSSSASKIGTNAMMSRANFDSGTGDTFLFFGSVGREASETSGDVLRFDRLIVVIHLPPDAHAAFQIAATHFLELPEALRGEQCNLEWPRLGA